MGTTNEQQQTIVLPEEKDWMMAAAHGDLKKLEKLLNDHPALAAKKDFVMGYTALHWAAKLGRPDIVKFVLKAGVDVHTKSHGGYTPLHIAAMSGRDPVIIQLIELYNANIHARDHGGKKPRDVVRDTVAADVQRKLGRSLILEPNQDVIGLRYLSTLRPPVRSRPTSFVKTDEEVSPVSTPELVRRNLKSIGASAQRSMSFLKKKKKDRLRPEDIRHSPQPERRNFKNLDSSLARKFSFQSADRQERLTPLSKNRPKSLVISSPTKLQPVLGEPTISFEI